MARLVVAGVLVGVASLVGVALPGTAQAQSCAKPGVIISQLPWAQNLLKPTEVWPYTQGGGVKVAVLDSGVDHTVKQLTGHVSAGFDALAGHGPADNDCLGSGTQVAAVIAAAVDTSIGFVGLAPRVTIVPIRVIDDSTTSAEADPDILARGIDAAVEQGADVIVVSAVSHTGSAQLAAAVQAAEEHGVTVVAAAGDLGDTPLAPDPYPAAYPDVIGVGAIDQHGQRWSKSPVNTYVDLVAPGDQITTLQTGGGEVLASGTGLAAGFVGATAALVRAKKGASILSTDIERRLEATTTPTPGGDGYGHGLVNPLAAVSDPVVDGGPVGLPVVAAPSGDTTPASARSRDLAIAGAGLAMVVVFLIVLGAVTMPRGRRRFWRSILARPPAGSSEPDEPGPPLPLFEEQQTR